MSSKGWVIFATEAIFNAAHNQAKETLGLPKHGEVNGKPAPNNQMTTDITACRPHNLAPINPTVVAYINGGWPEDQKTGFVFLTRDQVSDYFPDQEDV